MSGAWLHLLLQESRAFPSAMSAQPFPFAAILSALYIIYDVGAEVTLDWIGSSIRFGFLLISLPYLRMSTS